MLQSIVGLWFRVDRVMVEEEIILALEGSHRLEKYVNTEGFLEMSLKIKSALKSTGKLLLCLEKTLNFTIFCRT